MVVYFFFKAIFYPTI